MDHVVRLVIQTLGAEFCQVRELSADGGAPVLKAGVGWKPGTLGQSISSSPLDSQAGSTLLSNEPASPVRHRGDTVMRPRPAVPA